MKSQIISEINLVTTSIEVKGTRYLLTFEDDESRDEFLKEYMLELSKKEDDE